ncbi:hydrolase [Shewanella sp. OPT22]|nr:hydrolase [Shewanella sp. OPT22]
MKNNKFCPPWWLKNTHIQTILPVMTKVPLVKLQRQRIELDDGDFIDLDWTQKPQLEAPIVLIFHGLEGSSESHYARRMLAECGKLGLSVCVHHHRSCSGESNRLARSYHSGDTQDISITLDLLKHHFPHSPIWAVGYSLGGNVLTKYLGEAQSQSLIERAVVVSAPLQLSACAKRLENGFSKVYQSYLIKQLRAKLRVKIEHPKLNEHMPVAMDQVEKLNTFYVFDDKVTAPLHGFKDVHDYYQQASGLPYLISINTPTLVIHAKDDPFMTEAVIPNASQLSSSITYELHQQGGHVGFINGGLPWKPTYYLEPRIIDFFTESE